MATIRVPSSGSALLRCGTAPRHSNSSATPATPPRSCWAIVIVSRAVSMRRPDGYSQHVGNTPASPRARIAQAVNTTIHRVARPNGWSNFFTLDSSSSQIPAFAASEAPIGGPSCRVGCEGSDPVDSALMRGFARVQSRGGRRVTGSRFSRSRPRAAVLGLVGVDSNQGGTRPGHSVTDATRTSRQAVLQNLPRPHRARRRQVPHGSGNAGRHDTRGRPRPAGRARRARADPTIGRRGTAFAPTEQQEALVALARQLGHERFARGRPPTTSTRRFPSPTTTTCEAGLLRLCVPTADGGLGADFQTYCLVAAELGRHCGATALTFNMHSCTCMWAGQVCDDLPLEAAVAEAHRRRRSAIYRLVVEEGALFAQPFSEPNHAVAAGRAPFGTTATRVPGGWSISGAKHFTSLAGAATHYGVLCTEDIPGKPPRPS